MYLCIRYDSEIHIHHSHNSINRLQLSNACCFHLQCRSKDCTVLKIEAENSSEKLAPVRQSENKIFRTTEYFINKISCGRRHRKTGFTPVLIIALFLHTIGTDISLNTFSISRRLIVVRKEPYNIFIEVKLDSVKNVNCNQHLPGIENSTVEPLRKYWRLKATDIQIRMSFVIVKSLSIFVCYNRH
jgi:hypothetical protein